MTTWRTAARLAWLLVVGASAAGAQTLPSEPIALAGGRVTIGGDVSASFGSQDPGFFNYTDYSHSALRLMRIDLSAAVRMSPHFTLLGEVRTENLGRVRPYALFLRIRPWTARDFDIQIGRVPPTFGAFARRTYANDNPLVGYPLAYQYLTTMRPDALAANADELLAHRSTGWLLRYSIGDRSFAAGVPLVSAFRWDTGVQVHGTRGIASATASVTAGTLSNPLFKDDNGGRQIAARLELRPTGGLSGIVAGTSLAHGPFLSQTAARAAVGDVDNGAFTQDAWGGDLEYSRDHYLLRVETIVSGWHLPIVRAPALAQPLRAVSTSVEGRYTLRPGLYVAARYDHLGFNDVVGTSLTAPWDAPVSRIEAGAGYSIERNLLLKGSYQHNSRDGGVELPAAHLIAAQVVYWF